MSLKSLDKKLLLPISGQRIKVPILAMAVFGVLIIGVQWALDNVEKNNLTLEVNTWTQWHFLESKWTYFYLHIFTVIPVLALSFDKKVAFYKKWRFLFPAITIVAAFFIAWDIFFTLKEVWGFNDRYLSGLRVFHLPIEEILFFFTVPFACVFIYECLNAYIKKDLLASLEGVISRAFIFLFLGIGLWMFWHMYTATTFILAGLFLLGHLLFLEVGYRSRFYLAYLVSWIPFMLVNGVLTGGFTQEPVVIYNQEEYFGLRLGSVPVDDSIYSFLMLMAVVSLYEYFQNSKKKDEASS